MRIEDSSGYLWKPPLADCWREITNHLGSAVLLVFAGVAMRAQDDSLVVKHFESRVKKYQSLKSDFGIPNKQTNSANELADEKHQATEKIHAARPAAKQGDIFTPQIAEYFKNQIASTLNGVGGDKVRASLQRAEPVRNVHLQVNTPYRKTCLCSQLLQRCCSTCRHCREDFSTGSSGQHFFV